MIHFLYTWQKGASRAVAPASQQKRPAERGELHALQRSMRGRLSEGCRWSWRLRGRRVANGAELNALAFEVSLGCCVRPGTRRGCAVDAFQ